MGAHALPVLMPAPELEVAEWLNSSAALSLAALRGKVIAIHAFQMLCPGCVQHGIPQAQSMRAAFPEPELAVLGLHSVFEHHEGMGRAALQAFVHEYRIGFPVAIDQPSGTGAVPLTMARYQLRGTPSLLLIDRCGMLRLSHFGRLQDLRLGAMIGALLAEPGACDEGACTLGQ